MKRLSLSILLMLAAFVFGPLRMPAQDASAQTRGPEGPARGALDKDQQLALMRQDMQSIRKKLIGDNLDLTVTEAAKFWPVYEEYSTDFGKIDEDRSLIVKEYSESFGSVTDEQADNLIRRWLDTDISAAKLRQKYVPIMRTVLSGKKSATFFQPDRRISMIIDVQIMSQIPLVQSQLIVPAKIDEQ
jgi:Ni/Co efflux regulator RcnB